MSRVPVLPVLITVGLALSACGDDGDEGAGDDGTTTTEATGTEDTTPDGGGGGGGGDRQDYVDVTAELLNGALPLQDDEAACFAAALVDAIDFEKFVEAGISPEELRTSEELQDLGLDIEDGIADRFGENLGPCAIDYASVLLTFDGPSEATQAGIDCVNAQLDREQLDQLLAIGATSGFTGVEPETDLPTLAQPALDACAAEISGAGG